jgi:hypothetical protein
MTKCTFFTNLAVTHKRSLLEWIEWFKRHEREF